MLRRSPILSFLYFSVIQFVFDTEQCIAITHLLRPVLHAQNELSRSRIDVFVRVLLFITLISDKSRSLKWPLYPPLVHFSLPFSGTAKAAVPCAVDNSTGSRALISSLLSNIGFIAFSKRFDFFASRNLLKVPVAEIEEDDKVTRMVLLLSIRFSFIYHDGESKIWCICWVP